MRRVAECPKIVDEEIPAQSRAGRANLGSENVITRVGEQRAEGWSEQQHEQIVQHQRAQTDRRELRELRASRLTRSVRKSPVSVQHKVVDNAGAVRDRIRRERWCAEPRVQSSEERKINERSQHPDGKETPDMSYALDFKRIAQMSHSYRIYVTLGRFKSTLARFVVLFAVRSNPNHPRGDRAAARIADDGDLQIGSNIRQGCRGGFLNRRLVIHFDCNGTAVEARQLDRVSTHAFHRTAETRSAERAGLTAGWAGLTTALTRWITALTRLTSGLTRWRLGRGLCSRHDLNRACGCGSAALLADDHEARAYLNICHCPGHILLNCGLVIHFDCDGTTILPC